MISYVKQTIFYYSDHVDRWSLFKQLRSFSAQGILGGGGIQFTSQPVSSVHEMRGLEKFKYFSNVVDHSSLHLQSLHSVVDSLRLVFEYFQQPTQQPIQGQGAFFQSLLEAIFQQVIIPVESSFIFTEISLFLEQHPVFQHYLEQNKHQAQSYLNGSSSFVEEDQDVDSLADPQSAYHLLHRLLPAKETFYSMIQLYKSYFQNRLVFLSEQDNEHRTVVEVETDLLSAENHLHRESSITTLLGSEDLKLLCRTSLDLKAIEVMISEYFLHFKQMNFHTDERFYLIHEVLEQHQILGLLTNYINVLFFQNKEFFLHSTSQQQQTLIEGGSRRKSRNNSLLLDFNPITEDDSSKTQSDSLLLTVENIQHLVTREEQGGDNRVCHLPPSSQMLEFLNNHYLPFHLNCGLFTRSVTEMKKQSPWVYFYSDHFLNVNDVISSFLPPLSLSLPVSADPRINSSRYDEETKETELFHLLKEVFFDEDELIYSQLSGPGDILTVLMAVTSFDPVTKRLKGRVRVINHSAFKIPYFSLSLLVQANMLLSNPTQHFHSASAANSAFHLFPPEHLHIHKENMGICASLESGELLSAEYFPANAIIERDFNITWHFFAPFDIIARLEYTELSRNQDIYSNFPAINSQAVTNSHVPSTPSANRKQDFQRLVPCYLETNQGIDYQIFHNQYDLPASQQRNYLKYNAVIDMPPFHISIAYLLRAYANHQFRALCYWKLQQLHPSVFSRHRDMEVALFPVHSLIEELPREVVPGLLKVLGVEKMRAVHDFTLQWPFFQEQFLRLTDRYSHSCVIAVPIEVNDLPPTHNHLLLQTTLLRFFTNLQEELFRQPFNAISGELGAIGLDCISLHPQQRALGWTLQTVWNDDIAVQVQFHPKRFQLQSTQSVSDIRVFDVDENEESSEEMFGRLQIRCGESHILQAILIDLVAFINALSGGFFTLIPEEQ